jgi:hypothetical protein
LIAVAFVASGGPTPPNWATKTSAIAAAVTALFALLAVLGAVFQLRQNRANARVARAHSYLERYNDLAQLESIVRMHAFVSLDGTSQAARIAEWQNKSHQEQLETVHALNFWEELAGMYNRNQVDRPIVRDYFGSAALDYWNLASWFAAYQRGIDSPTVLGELERMCEDIARHR